MICSSTSEILPAVDALEAINAPRSPARRAASRLRAVTRVKGTRCLCSSGALRASAKVPKRARNSLGQGFGVAAGGRAEQDQLEQLVIGEGIGARLAEASSKPLA